MVTRPSNHVTRDLARRFIETGAPFPDLTEAQVIWLEAQYPPRCFDPTREHDHQHQRYAGKVELTAMLRAQLEARADTNEHLDPSLMPADLASE